MKCCPKDKTIKKEWTDGLERESNNLSNDKVAEISDFSYVFSHPLRVRIAFLLYKGDLCVCEIVSILKEKQNLVSHHISIMKKYGVISSYHQSKYKYYTINSAAADFLRTVERTAVASYKVSNLAKPTPVLFIESQENKISVSPERTDF